jgi:hypothetical protein
MHPTMALMPVHFEVERSSSPSGRFRFNFALPGARMTLGWPRICIQKGA